MGFEWAYRHSTPPWDIGRAQPAVVALADSGEIAGRVIDLGCGTGENALHLAGRGLTVVGLDAAATAIDRARAKAAARGLAAEFVLGDALDLARLDGQLGGPFDAVVDCGLFHVFADGERPLYERSLAALLPPGGRYFMLCFSDEQPGTAGPRRISRAEIRATFAAGWRVDSIEPRRFATVGFQIEAPKAWLARITRLPDPATVSQR
jgi:cyclopropane fatty-acyl-phospholipid synthase-like methyltransferase